MSLPVWIDNLVAYSLQIAILAAAGTVLVYLFRLRVPRIALAYWQALLLVCVLVFAFQRWRHPVFTFPIAQTAAVDISPVAEVAVAPPSPSFRFDPEWIGWILAGGIVCRLLWMGIGLFRLRSFRCHAKEFSGDCSLIRDVQSLTETRSSVLVSDAIDSPVTFGIQKPIIILPAKFDELSKDHQRAILSHELLHIRRRDWLFIIGEETVRSFFWFHPAIWWVLGRIRLSREQAVDQQVVKLCGNRQPYLDSLLEFARTQRRSQAVPAPLFLKENHLVQRVALLLKEASMSRSRLFCSLTAITILLLGTVRLAAGWFPLTGAPIVREYVSGVAEGLVPQPQAAATPAIPKPGASVARQIVSPPAKETPVMTAENLTPALHSESAAPVQEPPAPFGREPIRVGGGVQESKLIYKVEPVYPELARKSRVSGTVVMVVTANEEGLVSDIKVNNGHPLLVEAAIAAVKQWRYNPSLLNGVPVPVMFTVTCIFNLKGDNDAVLQIDEYGNLSELPPGDMSTFMQRMAKGGTAQLNISSAMPIRRAEEIVQELLQRGVQKLEVRGAYAFYQGKLFYSGAPTKPPQIIPNLEVLRGLLDASPKDSRMSNMVFYNLYISEVGEIVGVQRFVGPDNPEIERELMRSQVLSPAFLGTDPIPFVYTFRMGM